MVLGRQEHDWELAAWQAAQFANVFAKQAVDPDKINPFRLRLQALGRLPGPPRQPFSLGSFDALVAGMKGSS